MADREKEVGMTERERIITGLESCTVKQNCSECPWEGRGCLDRLHLAALKLLNTLNPQEVVRLFMLCPECGKPILNGWKHCAHCGAKLEEGEA